MKTICTHVDVIFLIPGVGPITERYDRRVKGDLQCWAVNGATYPIASQNEVAFVDEEVGEDGNTPTERLIAAARADARHDKLILRTGKA